MNISSNQKIKLVPLTNVNEQHDPSSNKLGLGFEFGLEIGVGIGFGIGLG
jgi:hypothetical protein